jgi:transposase
MPVGQVYIIGVDDWSWRRGKRFGSILVNLETHKIVDLLPDREAESVKRWLAAHPEVDVVSRDRGGCSIDGATWGASQATQVAHRWHLLSNLGEAVEAFLIRTQIRLDHEALSEQCHKPDHPLSSFSATPGSQRSQLDPYEDYLLDRWSQGERNAAQLYREKSRARISRQCIASAGSVGGGPLTHDHHCLRSTKS